MKKYPYIQHTEKIENFVCDNCKKETVMGLRLEWRVDWFQGNCEFEKTCVPCRNKAIKEYKVIEEVMNKKAEIEYEHDKNFWADMKARLEKNYEVQYLTPYQWRINGVVDIFHQSRRFHDIKKNVRGDYRDMHEFLNRFFRPLI